MNNIIPRSDIHSSIDDASAIQSSRTVPLSVKRLNPLTAMYTDRETGNQIRLFEDKAYGLVGAVVTPSNDMCVVRGDKVHNALAPVEAGGKLLARLRDAANLSWDLVYKAETAEIYVWPHLKAAAPDKDNYAVARSINPFRSLTKEQCSKVLEKMEYKFLNTTEKGGLVYYRPTDGRRAYVDPGGYYGKSYEPPHVDIYYTREIKEGKYEGSKGLVQTVPILKENGDFQRNMDGTIQTRERIIEAKKFPLTPGCNDWYRITNRVRESYSAAERLAGRDPFAKPNVPTMQKGGIEMVLTSLSALQLYPEMQFVIPLESLTPQITLEDVYQIVRELFVGMYICNEVPSLAMDSNADKTVAVSMPAPYRGTLVGDVLKEVDALGKGVMQGIVFPEHARRAFMEVHTKVLALDGCGRPSKKNYEEVVEAYQAYGARLISEHPELLTILQRGMEPWSRVASHVVAANYTFIAHQKGVSQQGNVVVLNSDLYVGGSFVTLDGQHSEETQQAHDTSAACIREILLQIPEAKRNVELLKVIGFMVQLLGTLKAQNLMPDLNAVESVPMVFEPEDSMPPFLNPRDIDGVWGLHGAAGIDFTTVELTPVDGLLANSLSVNRKNIKQGGVVSLVDQDCLAVPISIVRFSPSQRKPEWMHDMIDSYRGAAHNAESADLPDELKNNLRQRLKTMAAQGFADLDLVIAAADAGSTEMLNECWEAWSKTSWSNITAQRSFGKLLNSECNISLIQAVIESGSLSALVWLNDHGLDFNRCHENGLNYALAFAHHFDKPAMVAYLTSKGMKNSRPRMRSQATEGEIVAGLIFGSHAVGPIGAGVYLGLIGSSLIGAAAIFTGAIMGGAAVSAAVVFGARRGAAFIYNNTFARRTQQTC